MMGEMVSTSIHADPSFVDLPIVDVAVATSNGRTMKYEMLAETNSTTTVAKLECMIVGSEPVLQSRAT